YTFGNKQFLPSHLLKDPSVSALQNVAGFHAQGIFVKVVDIRQCHLQEEPTNKIRIAVKEFGLKNDYSFYDIRNHQGLLRTMQTRICRTGEIMVNIVFGEEKETERIALLEYIQDLF